MLDIREGFRIGSEVQRFKVQQSEPLEPLEPFEPFHYRAT
jgi:hypothetical protein